MPEVSEAAPVSAVNAPVAPQVTAIPAVGAASEQERFTAIVEKVKRDAAKSDLAARQAALEPSEETAEPAEELVEGEAVDAAESDASEAAPEAAAKSATDRSLAKIKALLAADPAAAVDALETALGKEAVKALKLDSKQWAAFRHEKKQFRAAAEEREAQLAQIHGKLSEFHASLQPLAQARQAFEDGDFQKAHELAFGMDVNEFQKRALKQKSGEDPKVARLEREIAEERRLRAEHEQRKAEAEQARQAQEQEVAYLAEIQQEVAGLDDSQLAAAAAISGFADQILEIQRDHFDRRTRSTLPTITAAEMALEKFREAYDRWTPVFAGLDRSEDSEEVPVRAAPAKAATKGKEKAAKPAVAPAKPRKSLTQSTASEAAGPGRALTAEEIYQKHLRLMERAAIEELATELG